MNDYFRIGQFTSVHGVKGEISLYPTTDELERFRELKECYILKNGEYMLLHVTGCKYKKNMPVLKFEEYNSIEEVEALKGSDLYVDREHAIPLEEGEFYLADTIGFKVISEGETIGEVADYTENEADQTIFIVKCTDGTEKYILDIPEFIKNVDIEEGTIEVNIVKGM